MVPRDTPQFLRDRVHNELGSHVTCCRHIVVGGVAYEE